MKRRIFAILLCLALVSTVGFGQIKARWVKGTFTQILTFDKQVLFKELAAAPSETTGYGTLYAKSADGLLYWKTGAGVEHDITTAGAGAPSTAHYLTDQAEAGLSAEVVVTANGKSLVTAANYAAMRTLLDLEVGTDFNAYDADLTTYAGITPSANIQTFLGAADYAAMRTQLGLVIGTNVQAYDADLTTWGGITPSANVQSLVSAADYGAIGDLLEATIEDDIDTLANLTSVQGQTISLSAGLTVESTSVVNQDLSSDATPTFAGVTLDSGAGGDLRIYDADQSNYTSITQQAIAGNLSITLPAAAPTVNNSVFAASTAGAGVWIDSAKTVILKVMAEATVVTAGDGAMYFTIPAELNGMNLVSVGAHVYTADDAADAITVDIYNFTDSSDMLSTALTIDGSETDSATAATPAAINAAEDDVVTADVIRIDVTTYAGDNAAGLEVRLGFRLP